MNMKKHVLLVLLLGLTTSFCYSQVKVSVQGGAGFSGITKDKNYKADFGYRFGVGVEFPLARAWSLQTGLQLLNRKSSIDEDVLETRQYEGETVLLYETKKSKMSAVYLQLPVKMATYLPLNTDCGLQISAGPYIAYGIGGNIDGEMKRDPHWSGDSFVPEEIRNLAVHRGFHLETFNRDSGLKRLDIGLSVGVDFKYKSFFVGGAVEYGLLPVSKEFLKNMFEDVFGENKITRSPHNFGMELHVGYCFNLWK